MRRLDVQGRVDVQPYQREGVPASVGATVEECRGSVQWWGSDGVVRANPGWQERLYRWVADHSGRFPGTTPQCRQRPQDC